MRSKGPLRSLAVLLCAAPVVAASASEATFEMAYYSNSRGGGTQMAGGDYAAAIAAAKPFARSADLTTALVATTNLCVALTVTGDFAGAAKHCDRAVGLARRVDGASLGTFGVRDATSRALSNRGVLQAMRGDVSAAAADFRSAAKARRAWKASHRNLAYLESTAQERVAAIAARSAE